jgi:hypothetical protein
MRKISFFSLLFILGASPISTAQLLLPSTAELEIKAGNFTLDMNVSLIEENGIWEVSSKVGGIVKREEFESFILENERIIPLQYYRKQKILFKRKDSKAIFDWDSSSLSFKENKKKGTIDLEENVLGPSTATLKLRIDVKSIGLKNLPEIIQYKVYYNGEIKERTYQFGEIEEVNTLMGKLKALRVSRVFANGENRKQIYWLCPEFDFSIIRIVDENNERNSDIRIKSISF